MPLSKIQTEILRLLAGHRDPESYVAGASALNRDAQTLEAAGYLVRWIRREPAISTAQVAGRDGSTHLE